MGPTQQGCATPTRPLPSRQSGRCTLCALIRRPFHHVQAHPEFRQAEALLEACDKEIMRDGLVGLGAGAAIVGGIAAIAIAAMRR